VVAISSVVGIVMGMLAAYYGGILDAVVMRLADTVFAFSTTCWPYCCWACLKPAAWLR
jgi:peptide/nickel transport system permease protein